MRLRKCHSILLFVLLAQRVIAGYPDPGRDWPSEVLPAMNGSASDFAPRRAGAEVSADLRIGVSSQALYRVTQTQLVAAGWSAVSLTGTSFRLFCRTQEVAITVSTNTLFGTNDYVQFYGSGHDGFYSSTNVYWLGLGTGGLRVAAYDASTNAGGAVVTTHVDRVRFNPDLLYRDFYLPLDGTIDHWFAGRMTNSGYTATSILTDERVSVGSATFVGKFCGLTSEAVNPDHTTRIRINGSTTLNTSYDGEQSIVATNTFASSLLSNGATIVTLREVSATASNDQAYLVEYYIDYPRQLKARSNQLVFWGSSGTNIYLVSGFTTNKGVVIMDITDPVLPRSMTNGSVNGSGGSYTAAFRHVSVSPCRYLVSAQPGIAPVTDLNHVFFRGLATTNQQADYIGICPYPLRAAGYTLLKHRATNGMQVVVAPVDDVYNEFSYGVADVSAIKQFLGYAFHHWSGSTVRFACLMGDGTYDPRNNLGLKPAVTIPVKYGPAASAWSPQDAWLGTVNGSDLLTDISIGRIPVSSTTELQRVTAKIVAYESDVRVKRATLVADNVDGSLNFQGSTQTNIASILLSGGYTNYTQYLDVLGSSVIRGNLSNDFNNGRQLVTFVGHGSAVLWCSEDVWNTNDVAHMTNTRFPIVGVFSCESGSFDDPAKECLAEAFVKRASRGAVACVAPAALSNLPYSERIAAGFSQAFTNNTSRLGDCLNAGLLRLWQFNPNVSELSTYVIIGDPATKKP